MKRKAIFLLIAAACLSLFLSGAKPKLISEEEAKKAGLAFINHMFDVNLTKATVSYGTHAGSTYIDGEYKETGDVQPVHFYGVNVPKDESGIPLYHAMVNAETGVVYFAGRDYSLVPKMTAEQRGKWIKANGNGDGNAFDYASMDIDCTDFAREWIPQKFDLKAKILGFVDCGTLTDNEGAYNSFYVVIRDGTIYYVDIAWPQLAVLDVGVLNQIRPYEGEP